LHRKKRRRDGSRSAAEKKCAEEGSVEGCEDIISRPLEIISSEIDADVEVVEGLRRYYFQGPGDNILGDRRGSEVGRGLRRYYLQAPGDNIFVGFQGV
jgi:hypothetical protein